jgi:hydroxypyruvate isomerase
LIKETTMQRRSFLGAGLSLAATSSAARAQDVHAQSVADLGRTPNTRFAVNVEMWWRGLPFVERVQKAIDFGFPAYEMWPWQGKDLDALEKLSKDGGIEVAQFTGWGFTPGMNDPVNHDAVEQAIRAGCAVANKLGAKAMTVIAGNDQEGMTNEVMHAHVITALKRVAPIAEDADVTLILEPMNGRVDHPGHCLYGSPAAVRICREVGSTHVKINWDLYHMQISEGDLCGHLRSGLSAFRPLSFTPAAS